MADRKKEIEQRREALNDRINLAHAERVSLGIEYDEILDAEELHDEEGLVKLSDVPNKTWISLTKDPTTLIYFDHPDGMYSYCVSPLGQLTHINLGSRVYVHEELDLEAPVFPALTPGQFRTT